MPEPISSSSTAYDPSSLQSHVDGCEPSAASCAAFPPVEIPEVHIEGDAGKQALLERLEASRCESQTNGAMLSCLAVGVAAAQRNPLAAFVASLVCGKDIGTAVHCRETAAAQTAAIAACEARDGTPLASARENEVICLVSAP